MCWNLIQGQSAPVLRSRTSPATTWPRPEAATRRRGYVAGILTLIMALCWGGQTPADETQESAIETLLQRITQLEQTVAQQQALIRQLQERLGLMESEEETGERERSDTVEIPAELEQQLAEELGAAPPQTEEPAPAPPPPPSRAVGQGKNFLNLSLDGLASAGTSTEPDVPGLQLGSHDPSRRGFTVQNVEVVLNGAVDPYFTAQANIVFVESPEGETEVEVEEIYATTSSLPYNLQVKAGHFFTEFGRLNAQHPHFWDFVDQPLSHARMFGADNLRSSGARVSWLMPVPFYSEFFLAVQNAFGETLTSFGFVEGEEMFGRTIQERSVRTLGDLLFVPRYSASLDLTSNQTVLFGASAALGPNGTGDESWTNVYGVDVFWKWKSPRAIQGFPFVKVQAEGIERRYRADDPLGTETLEDWGAYGQVVWGFKRGWVIGVRYGEVGGDEGSPVPEPELEDRHRGSVNVTWFPTEYSKLRLQYNRDERSFFKDADSLWLQFEFILGAHAAHKF